MPNEPLYERLAQSLERQIRAGSFRAGEKIPSVRKLSKIEKVSIATVLQAYILLEGRGWLEARPQSGFYVRLRETENLPEPESPRLPSSSSAVKISELVASVFGAARNPSIVPLGTASPAPSLLPIKKLNQTVKAILNEHPTHSAEYDFPPGALRLRRQLARRSVEWGCRLSPDDLITTSGGMEAINLSLRAVAEPGDTIAVESPAYFGILQAMESLRMKALEIPSHPRDGIDLDRLEQAIRRQRVKACIVVPNFSNPLGSRMPDAHKEAMVRMLSEREIPIIEDDLYGDLAFDGSRPRALKSYDQEGWVLHCSSFSKSLSPGLRVGWVAPGRFRREIEQLKFMNTIATATLPQLALAQYLESGGYDRHLRRIRQAFCLQIQRAREAIQTHFPPETQVSRPEGGFVLWVGLPKRVDSIELHRQALRNRISVSPGVIFSASGGYRNFIRLNCGNPWDERIAKAFETLGKLCR